MSKYVTAKEALADLYGHEYYVKTFTATVDWKNLSECEHTIKQLLGMGSNILFRKKPQTVKINGIEVPKPFKPNVREEYFFVCQSLRFGYSKGIFDDGDEFHKNRVEFGVWRTEVEIKQVLEALKIVFSGGWL